MNDEVLKRPAENNPKGEISLVDLLIVVAKRKKLIFGVPVIVAILSAALSFAIPKTFQASAKLLPPQQNQSSASALLSQLGGMAGVAAGAAGLKNPGDLYVGMLKSRTVADRLIAQFGLKDVYKADTMETARNRLEANTSISSGKDGLITITVEGRDQKLVAPLANAYVSELLRLTKVLAVTEASQRRMFFEHQFEQVKDNLAKAEMALKGALNTRGVVSIDGESRAIVETVGRLKAQVSAKEIQLSSMRAFVTNANPEYRRAEEELNGLRSELSKLENGRGAEVSVASESKPGGLENIKLLRDLKYHQMLYEMLAKQYEISRLDEAKDPSIVQVLDQAIEPERKSKPSRALIVVLSTMMSFVLALLWAFFSESQRKAMQLPDEAARWSELKSYLKYR